MLSPHLTESGFAGIGTLPYGAHLCHFYAGRRELVEALVPYFEAGLRNGERCLWVTASPLPAREARAELARVVASAVFPGACPALQVTDFEDWYTRAAGFDGREVLGHWLREEARALEAGYRGLRIAGNLSFLTPAQWPAFMDYEQAVTQSFAGRRIVALCSYQRDQCCASGIDDARQRHHCTLERADAGWKVAA